MARLPILRTFVLLSVLWLFGGVAAAQTNPTLTINTTGDVSGAVGAQPNGNVCNPNPGGGPGSGSCTFVYQPGTHIRIMANSPNTPGIFSGGTGDAAACATSVCEFDIHGDSAITATFDSHGGPYPALTIQLAGDGKGNVGTDNNQCQNFELGFSACTTHYGAGSAAVIQGRSVPGNIFGGFSAGTVDAHDCTGTANCNITLSHDSSITASFSALESVSVTPNPSTMIVGSSQIFSSHALFTNGMTRFGFTGTNSWFTHVPMDVARFSLAAATVNDRLYAIGGVDGTCPSSPCPFAPLSTVEMFDPTVGAIAQVNQVWTPRASMHDTREGLAAVAVNGRIYAMGGHTGGGAAVASMESYNPATNQWSYMAPMSAPRAAMAAAAINNTIYVAGGNADAPGGGHTPVNTLEAYDTATDTWSARAPMATTRAFPAAAAVNGILYVIGGDGAGTVEAYNPATDSWTPRAPIPGGGGDHRAVALNGLIYAMAGNSGILRVYNPAVNSWLTLGTMPSPQRGEMALAVLDGRIFAAGGLLADQTATAAFTAIRPPEATWWSSNTSVATINQDNSGRVNAQSIGTSTISARLVTIDSGAQSAALTVSGNSSPIFVNTPTDPPSGTAWSTEVGQSDWGACGTFSQNAPGPWTVQVNYGDNTGSQNTPFILNPSPDGHCVQSGQTPTGEFFFNHAYNSPGTFQVTVTVTNTATSASQSRSFHIRVDPVQPQECAPVTLNFTAIGTLPFTTVHVELFDRVSGEPLGDGDVPFGGFDIGGLPEGSFRVQLSVPAGYQVTPSTFNIDPVCGQPIVIAATVQLIPVAPPTIVRLTPSETSLWPVNHKYHAITIAAVARAADGANISGQCVIVSASSNEPNTDNDFVITGPLSVNLRAERLGAGSGRTYTMTVRCTDGSGLSTTGTATVAVPHDQRK